MTVEIIKQASPEVEEAFALLIPQLSSSATPMNQEQIDQYLNQPGTYLFAFRDKDTAKILGLLTMVTFSIPTGKKAWIEDVVVDAAARGQGAGQALVEAAIAQARELEIKNVDLTSRPSREAANRLYLRCGFETRETNVYRYKV